MPAPDYQVQSLARAVAILKAFNADQPELSIGEIAVRLGLPRSTVHRLVVNLVRFGLLTRDTTSERYRLGLLLVELGAIALTQLDLREKARPGLEELARQTGDAVFLAVLDQHWSVYIDKVEGRHSLRMTATIGRRAPLHCTATGQALLASLPEAHVRRIAQETGLPARTCRSITEVEALLRRLVEVRQRGFSIDDGESEEGLAGIAAPIRDASGRVIAVVGVAGPTHRIVPDGRPAPASLVVSTADRISAALGYRSAIPVTVQTGEHS